MPHDPRYGSGRFGRTAPLLAMAKGGQVISDSVRARWNSEAIVRFRVLVHQGDTIQNDRHPDLRSDVVLAFGA